MARKTAKAASSSCSSSPGQDPSCGAGVQKEARPSTVSTASTANTTVSSQNRLAAEVREALKAKYIAAASRFAESTRVVAKARTMLEAGFAQQESSLGALSGALVAMAKALAVEVEDRPGIGLGTLATARCLAPQLLLVCQLAGHPACWALRPGSRRLQRALDGLGDALRVRRLLVLGGSDTACASIKVDSYSPATGEWGHRGSDGPVCPPPLPTPCTRSTATVDAEGNVYIVGGMALGTPSNAVAATADILRYRIGTERWVSLPDLPEARIQPIAHVVDRVLYCIGGTSIDTRHAGVPCFMAQTSHFRYTVPRKMWRPGAPLPVSCCWPSDVQSGKYIYVVGGLRPPTVAHDSWRLDITTDVWQPFAPPPQLRHQAASVVFRGRLWILGGMLCEGYVAGPGQENPPLSTVDSFDLGKQLWATLDSRLCVARVQPLAVVHADRLFLFGGTLDEFAAVGVGVVEELDPATGTWSAHRWSLPSPRKNAAMVAWSCSPRRGLREPRRGLQPAPPGIAVSTAPGRPGAGRGLRFLCDDSDCAVFLVRVLRGAGLATALALGVADRTFQATWQVARKQLRGCFTALVAFGGASNTKELHDAETFCPLTQEWGDFSQLAAFRIPPLADEHRRSKATLAVAPDGRIYLVGGQTRTSTSLTMEATVLRCDPRCGGSWESLQPVPVGLFSPVVAPAADSLYVIGGMQQRSGDATALPTAVRQCFRYNVGTDTWDTLPLNPRARSQAGGALLGRVVYMVGGCPSPSDHPSGSNIVNPMYDTLANHWRLFPSAPIQRSAAIVGAHGKYLFVMGGSPVYVARDQDKFDPLLVDRYDIEACTWQTLGPRMHVPRVRGAACTVFKAHIYVFGGYSLMSGPDIGLVERMDLRTGAWEMMPRAAGAPRREASLLVLASA